MNKFYTYAFLREDKTPYYIGKGKGNRIYEKRKRIKPPKDKSRIIFLKKNLTEEEAFRHEIYMIAVLGRKDLGTGILHNKTDGGEGASGWVPSEETKRNMSEAGRRRTNSEESLRKLSVARKGKTTSEETKRKIGEANKGKTHSEESRRKLSEAHKGKTHSEESRRKMSEAQKGNTKMLGKTHSEESRRKMSEAKKGKTRSEETKRKIGEAHKNPSEETRRKLSEANKSRKWWNDGCGNRKRMLECPGDGWRLGRK